MGRQCSYHIRNSDESGVFTYTVTLTGGCGGGTATGTITIKPVTIFYENCGSSGYYDGPANTAPFTNPSSMFDAGSTHIQNYTTSAGAYTQANGAAASGSGWVGTGWTGYN